MKYWKFLFLHLRVLTIVPLPLFSFFFFCHAINAISISHDDIFIHRRYFYFYFYKHANVRRTRERTQREEGDKIIIQITSWISFGSLLNRKSVIRLLFKLYAWTLHYISRPLSAIQFKFSHLAHSFAKFQYFSFLFIFSLLRLTHSLHVIILT